MNFSVLLGAALIAAVFAGATHAQEIIWEPCYLSSTGNNTGKAMLSECANFSVPYNWTDLAGPRFNLFVKRTRNNGAQRALFIVPGGPGESGARTDDLVPLFNVSSGLVTVPYDIYQIDHRGTGRSARIGCTLDSEDGSGNCVAELGRNFSSILPHMTTTNAARDYLFVIDWVKANTSQSVVIYAGSYGTYLTNRILTLVPGAVSAAILDGVVAGPNKFSEQDANMNVTGQIFGAGCDSNPICARYLGGRAFESVAIVAKDLAMLRCTAIAAGLLGDEKFRQLLNGVLLDRTTRVGIFPLLNRVLRCSQDDQLRILNAVQDLQSSPPIAVGPAPDPSLTRLGYSRVLHNLISLSEMMFTPGNVRTKVQLDAISRTVPFANFEPGKKAALWTEWQTVRYTPDQYAEMYSPTDIPVLLLNGQMDGATGIAWARQARTQGFNKAGQRLIEIPEAGHITLLNSPVNNSAVSCGAQIITSFLNQNTFNVNNVNTNCLNFIQPTDFGGSSQTTLDYAQKLFGTSDIWGTSSPVAAPVAAPSRGLVSPPVSAAASLSIFSVLGFAVMAILALL